MKKFYGLIAVLLVGVGLVGCGDQKKATLEKNLVEFGNKNSYEVTIPKYQASGSQITKDQGFDRGTKLNIQVDKKNKLTQINTEMKIDNEKMNVDMIGNDSKMLMSTKSIASRMQKELKKYDSVEMPKLSKLNSTYVDLKEFSPSLDLSKLSVLWGGTDNGFKKTSKKLLKNEEVTKTKSGYLKVVLDKKDIKNMMADESKIDRQNIENTIKNYSKYQITMLSKGSKLIYKISAEDKSNNKADIQMNISAKNEKVSLKMPSDKQVITTSDMQKYLSPKAKS